MTAYWCMSCDDACDWDTDVQVRDPDVEISTIGSRFCGRGSCLDEEAKLLGVSLETVIEMRLVRGRSVLIAGRYYTLQTIVQALVRAGIRRGALDKLAELTQELGGYAELKAAPLCPKCGNPDTADTRDGSSLCWCKLEDE